MPVFVRGYESKEELSHGANGSYGIVEKDGKEYFLKRYNRYVYPDDAKLARSKTFKDAWRKCEEYRLRMEKLNAKLGEVAASSGDIVVALAFFREGNRLYKINEKIDALNLPASLLSARYSIKEIDALMCSVLYSMAALHRAGIVHADIKFDNIFLVEQEGRLCGKVGDFDDSFFQDEIPDSKDIVGTPEYFAPELGIYVASGLGSETAKAKAITCSCDMYSLGLLYHVYLTGRLPQVASKYHCVYQATLANDEVKLDLSLDKFHASLIKWMLAKNPRKRPSCMVVLQAIKTGKLPMEIVDPLKSSKEEKSCQLGCFSIAACDSCTQPLADVEVVAGDASTREIVARRKTDVEGKALLKLAPGKYVIALKKEGYLLQRKISNLENKGVRELSFELKKEENGLAKVFDPPLGFIKGLRQIGEDGFELTRIDDVVIRAHKRNLPLYGIGARDLMENKAASC